MKKIILDKKNGIIALKNVSAGQYLKPKTNDKKSKYTRYPYKRNL